jgi:hypothetical protein
MWRDARSFDDVTLKSDPAIVGISQSTGKHAPYTRLLVTHIIALYLMCSRHYRHYRLTEV